MLAFQTLSGILFILTLYLIYKQYRIQASLRSSLVQFTKQQDLNAALVKELESTKEGLTEANSTLSSYNTKYKPIIDLDIAIEERTVAIDEVNTDLGELKEKYKSNHETYKLLKKEISFYRNELEVMEFGLYQPQFDFQTSEEYKVRLERNYQKQKECIKAEVAIKCHTTWTVEGSTAKGKQMTKKYSKLMLYAFNGECDSLIAKIKWNTATRTKERIVKSFENINKLGESHQIEVTSTYLDLKLEEMALSHEYENKKYEEKEEQRRIREQMREEEKVLKELEKAQREADEEERRYQKALEKAQNELRFANGADIDSLNEQVRLLEEKLAEAHERKERAISMAQLTKVGHIYVISNVGSFGDGVYKIGMTRRLEPMDRIRELGDASVPFQFDVHAIIYSDNAPQLEYELHKKFNNRRLNRINGRKEFFKVSLDEIEDFVKEHAGAEIEFTKLVEAKEYRETLALLESLTTPELSVVEEELFPADLD